MLTKAPIPVRSLPRPTEAATQQRRPARLARAFLALAMAYLLLGLLFGSLGSLQYVLPAFLKESFGFQKTRPLHVYLATSWIFTAAQGLLYFYLPRAAGRPLRWPRAGWLHWWLQLGTSVLVIGCFFAGRFGGREYLEFPPVVGLLIGLSWLPLAANFFATLRPDFRTAPVFHWSWTVGILFFFITLSESYLWLLDAFFDNPVRDTTVQWKALGSMVGSWNMLIYGSTMFLMQRLRGDTRIGQAPESFFFFFLGFTNLLFNWGHHTYIVPAAPWVRDVSYVISMTELLLLAQLLWKFRRTMRGLRTDYNALPLRLLAYADLWILLNLAVAIALSVPALNAYTHGTHLTVAHAMGATIGINSMLLLASVCYIAQRVAPRAFARARRGIGRAVNLSNGALLVFWTSLVGAGLVKISAALGNEPFARMMQASAPVFRLFAASGLLLLCGFVWLLLPLFRMMLGRD
ncbi:MAG: cbb3-type cytochrome c oxidase subunit I [Chitinophagaceae bacterium]|nr:MAG: cbb3-type cytochrome c oxidase subunit I [Chitinophagaceae bacterium]